MKNSDIREERILAILKLKEKFIDDFMTMDKEELKSFCLKLIDSEVIDSHALKWKYAENLVPTSDIFQTQFASKNIFLAGDYFVPGNISGSIQSVKKATHQ